MSGSISSTLGNFTGLDAARELFGLALGNAGRLPVGTFVVFSEQHDLADVLGIVSDLAQDGLHDGVRIAANGDGARHIFFGEGTEFAEHDGPAIFPILHEGFAGGKRVFKFRIAVPPGLLAIFGEEIGKPRTHVAGHVLHDDRDRVGVVVDDAEEIVVA